MHVTKRKLYSIVFLTGAIVMMIELVGSRILAPTLGTSIYVWTSLIGIILGSMSLGYYLGGKLSDKNPNMKTFSNLILASGFFVFLVIIIKEEILNLSSYFGVRIGAVFAAISLFAAPSVLLGAISPYSVRIALKNIETSGNTVGNLYAVSTFGSIVGTFVAGFYFIPNFGSTNILYALAICLMLISILAYREKERIIKISASMFIASGISLVAQAKDAGNYIIDTDSEYNHIRVYDAKDEFGKDIRIMSIENFYDSGIYLESDEFLFEYPKYFRLSDIFKQDTKSVAVFGGAAYTIPMDILRRKKEVTVDVVEIDKKTTEIAKNYFNLDLSNNRLSVIHEDARTFLNAKNKGIKNEYYDVVYNDAFSSTCTMPFHLTTIEAIRNIHEILADDGIYIVNLISPIKGDKAKFFRAEYKTIKNVFENAYVFATKSNKHEDAEINQNLVVIATKRPVYVKNMLSENSGNEYGKMLANEWTEKIDTDNDIVLTDDYAPVDHYTSTLCQFVNKN